MYRQRRLQSNKAVKNKYGAKITPGVDAEGNIRKFPSALEARTAGELSLMMKAGEIEWYDCQYSIDIIPYNCEGLAVVQASITHKVDFRLHRGNDEFELWESKGFATREWRNIRKFIEYIWLPANPNYTYHVITDNQSKRYSQRSSSTLSAPRRR